MILRVSNLHSQPDCFWKLLLCVCVCVCAYPSTIQIILVCNLLYYVNIFLLLSLVVFLLCLVVLIYDCKIIQYCYIIRNCLPYLLLGILCFPLRITIVSRVYPFSILNFHYLFLEPLLLVDWIIEVTLLTF